MTTYLYARVSSKKQLQEGNGLEAQIKEMKNKYPQGIVVKEQFSGGIVKDRPKFSKLVNEVKEGDCICVAKLDRIARNVSEGLEVIQKLFNKGVAVHVLNVGLLENTTMGRFFLTTMLAVAEMEKETIKERMLAGKEVARQKEGYKEGRPGKDPKLLEKAYELKQQGKSLQEIREATGVCKSTLYRYIKENKKGQ